MSTFNESDHPRDVIGQFSEKLQSDAEVTLRLTPDSHPDIQRMFTQVREFAAIQRRRFRLSPETEEDIAQTATEDLMRQYARGRREQVMTPAYVNHAVKAVTQRHLNPKVHHTVLKARRMLTERISAFLQENARLPRQDEKDKMAEEIRLGMPSGRRPVEGFQHLDSEASLDRELGEGGMTFGETLVARDIELGAFAESDDDLSDLVDAVTASSRSAAERKEFLATIAQRREDAGYSSRSSAAAAALDAITSGGGLSKNDLRQNLWAILSGDGPQVAPAGTVKDRDAVLAGVKAAGGVSAAARSWSEGGLGAADTKRLFAPFAVKSLADRKAVVETLLRNPQFADQVFEVAVDAATDPKVQRATKAAQRLAARRVAAG